MKRIGRWVVPGTTITLACAGLVLLLAGEASTHREPLASTEALPPRAVPPARPPRPAVAPPEAPPPAPASPVTPAREEVPLPEPDLAPARVRESPASLRATPWVAQLVGTRDLQERLRVIDRLVRRLPDDRGVTVLEGLLDSELPGDSYEAATLRLHVLARLGQLPGPRATGLLVERLDPEVPRPVRLVALEMLARREHAGRAEISVIAGDDHDSVVQEKAQWVLARVR